MERIRVLFFVWIFAVGLWAQQPVPLSVPPKPNPVSPNGCIDPGRPFFRWKKMAHRPVGSPLNTFGDLKQFLAPRIEGGQRLFIQPWMQIGKAELGWKDSDLYAMWLAAEQDEGSNFQRVIVRPCEVFEDMIYDTPPTILGRAVLADWEDHQPKEAWVWQMSETVEAYFFVGCSNPTYKVRIPRPAEHPGEKVIAAKEAPSASATPPVVNVSTPPAQVTCPSPNVTCRADHPVTVNLPAVQKVEVTVNHKYPWDQRLFNLTGAGFHVIGGAWFIKNWDITRPGPKGDKGDTGPQGSEGKPCSPDDPKCGGPEGPQGPAGKDGGAGQPGKDGKNGKDGVPGSPGKDGAPGPAGPPGRDGKDGAPGLPGRDGAQGRPGAPGARGPQGPPGKDGLVPPPNPGRPRT